MSKEYSIGLDIGTNSVGWVVIDDDYKIIKKGKHPLWGVRLFDDAQTASVRRLKRGVRRRYARRKERINLLREEFRSEIEKVDPDFFKILDESFYVNYDDLKTVKIDKKFKKEASEYFKKFPTIYHLRNHLISTSEQEDIRLVYLAIHHIIKYRGNFKNEGKIFKISDINIINDIYNIIEVINSCDNLSFYLDNDLDVDSLENILYIENKKDKKKELSKFFDENIISKSDNIKENKNFCSELGNLLVGYKCDFLKMFDVEIDDDVNIKFDFNNDDYDKNIEVLDKYLGSYVEIIDSFKLLFDDLYLKAMFNKDGVNSISTLMMKKYDDHKNDLAILKEVFRNNKDARCLFKGKNDKTQRTGIYGKYLSKVITNDQFITEIEKISDKLTGDKKRIYDEKLLPRLNSNDFMPLVSSVENGKYAYQLNEDELVKIIESQGKYYPFLLNKINDEYRINKILKFKIPYYVGPLGGDHGKEYKNHWLIRNEGYENVKVTPFNFDDVVNRNDTAEQFVKRMVSNCTYLLSEKAMPANSILYSEFKVLNELKQIKIDDVPLDVRNVTFIYENLFKKNVKVSDKTFKVFLLDNRDRFNYRDGINVTGYSANDGFANNMKSYIDFFGDNGIFFDTSYNVKDAEQIIEWVTIFEDKSILKEKILNTYPNLNSSQINKILNLKYSGWSALSRKLLTEVYTWDNDIQQNCSIIDIMRNKKDNFMKIISKNDIKKQIDKLNTLELGGKSNINDVVADLATSPANKRGIIQAIKIVKAIVKKMNGVEPKNICIEMARGAGEKKKTDSRKKKIEDLYKTFKSKTINVDSVGNFIQVEKELKNYENDDLRNKRLFLYFMQLGKCMYCNKSLNVSALEQTTDIDHIIPQTLYKDDSFDNTCLVCSECNSLKSGSYVVPSEIRNNPQTQILWNHLNEHNYITQKKYDRLTRKDFSDDQINGFINRQLVETRQITKHVANILNSYYENTKVVYLHADLSSSYRKRYELYKFRDLNDLHHAHDAYLSAVLGIYKNKYFNNKIDKTKTASVSNLFKELKSTDHDMHYGYFVNSLDNKYGNYFSNCSLDEIKLINESITNNLYRNDILVSYKQFEHDMEFTDETVYSRNAKISSKIPLRKNLDKNIYGFRTNGKYCNYVVIDTGEKKCLLPMPYYLSGKEEIKSYFSELLKIDKDNLNILENKIMKNTVAVIDDSFVILNAGYGKRVEFKSVKQFYFSKEVFVRNKKVIYALFNSSKLSLSENSLRLSYIEMIECFKDFINSIPILKTSGKVLFQSDLESLSIEELKDLCLRGFNIVRSRSKSNNQICKVAPSSMFFIHTDILGLNKKIISIDDVRQ